MSYGRIVSWNVNGIRAIAKKGFADSVRALNPDILCIQETKATEEETTEVLREVLPDYRLYPNSSKARKGYSGTAIATRLEPVMVTYDLGMDVYDQEGRIITAEFPEFFLMTVYTPNSGKLLVRLDYREAWDSAFLGYVKWLYLRKPVVICGDLNVAHGAIDIARPKENYNKSAGYTQREIDGFDRLIESARLVDTFRHRYPNEVRYTYWNYINSGREKNIGWRIDYFLASHELVPRINKTSIEDAYLGSDHCPVVIEMTF